MPLSSAQGELTCTRRRVGRVSLHTGHGKLKFKIEQPQQGLLRLVKRMTHVLAHIKGYHCYKCINRKGQNYDFADNFTFYI